MKKMLFIFIATFFLCSLSSCNFGKVSLMYSGSYQDTGDFEKVVPVIDNYDDYLSSGYNFSLDEDFFDSFILYSVYSYIGVTGKDLYAYNNHRISDGILNIYLRDTKKPSGDAFSNYVLIFKIDKDLYSKVSSVLVKIDEYVFGKTYFIYVNDPNEYLLESVKSMALVGEIITIKTDIILDADLHLYINDEFSSSQTAIETNGIYSHFEFYFEMPAYDITLSFRTSGGM